MRTQPSSLLLLVLFQGAAAQDWKALEARADSLARNGQPDSAIVVLTEAIILAGKRLGENDTTVATVMRERAFHLRGRDQFDAAERDLLNSLRIFESVLGSDNINVAHAATELGLFYQDQDRYLEGMHWLKVALDTKTRILGPNHFEVGRSQHHLAITLNSTGSYSSAESLYYEAMATWTRSLGPNTWFIGKSLNNLTGMALQQGNYLRADSLSRLTLENWTNSLEPNSVWIGYGLELRGIVMEHLGKTGDAGRYYRRYVDHMEQSLDSLDHELADARVRYGDFLVSQREFHDAEREYGLALDSYVEGGGPDDHIATLLCRIAGIYFDRQEYSRGESTLLRALEILDTLVTTESREIHACEHVARVFSKQQRYSQALPYLERSLAMLQSISDSRHPSTGTLLLQIAEMSARLGDPVRADSIYSFLLPMQESAFGPQSIAVADAVESFAWFRLMQGKPDEAFAHSIRAFSIRRKHLSFVMTVQGEIDALRSGSRLGRTFGLLASSYFGLPAANSAQTRSFADAVLGLKGQVSDHLALRRRSLIAAAVEGGSGIAARYHEAKARLAALYTKGRRGAPVQQHLARLDSLSRRVDELEIEFGRTSRQFRRFLERQNVTAGEVARRLPEDCSLVEFVRFERIGSRDETEDCYAAVIVGGRGGLSTVNLGKAREIEDAVTAYRRHFNALSQTLAAPPSMEEYLKISSALHRLVWRPIQEKIRDVRIVFLAPDAALSLVSFAALANEKGNYLVEQTQVHYVTSGRDLLEGIPAQRGRGLLAAGAPDFDLSVEDDGTAQQKTNASPIPDGVPLVARNIRPGCESLAAVEVPALPGALHELQSVVQFWNGANPADNAVLLTGASASEEMFKQKCSGRQAIHLATHGYYLQGECVQRGISSSGENFDHGYENPLLTTGLLLAGVRRHATGANPGEKEDGVLTALEVSSLDLRGTDLVVLSACETGLGRIQQGEGVAGLRSAFQVAGARTVLSSLWRVPDDETARFMHLLYSNDAKDYPTLLQSAATQTLKDLRARGRSTHPFTWGAFVATGDWRRR